MLKTCQQRYLKKVLRLKVVNKQEELARIEKGMKETKLGEDEMMKALGKTPCCQRFVSWCFPCDLDSQWV